MRIKFAILMLLAWLCGVVHAEIQMLNIYTWAGYMPDTVIRQFEQETGITVNVSTYVNNEVLYAKLKANPDSSYDIIVPSTYMVERMAKNGLLQKIDKTKLTNLSNIDPIFLQQQYDRDNDHSVPYLWNATGIVVNRKYHPDLKIEHWKELWQPQYANKLLVLDDAREIFSMALLVLGDSTNSTDPEQIKRAFAQLNALMPNIKLFNTEAPRSIYIDEDITIGMSLNGDAYLAQKENANLEFFYPKEGFIVSLDSLAIAAGAKNLANAHKFINFVLRADIAKDITLQSGFPTTNLAAKTLLPDHIRLNSIVYPNAKTMQRAHFQTDVGAATAIYEKYFELLKLK